MDNKEQDNSSLQSHFSLKDIENHKDSYKIAGVLIMSLIILAGFFVLTHKNQRVDSVNDEVIYRDDSSATGSSTKDLHKPSFQTNEITINDLLNITFLTEKGKEIVLVDGVYKEPLFFGKGTEEDFRRCTAGLLCNTNFFKRCECYS